MVKQLYCCPEYLVDDGGFVISKRGKPLKPSVNHAGYHIITIMVNGQRKSLSVHTAVAMAFCEGYSQGLQVNHKDGNKNNNSATNLEWVTPMENMRHAFDTLGFNNSNENNPKAKEVVGKDKKTGKIIYRFPCVMMAARHFSPEDEARERHIEQLICGIAGGYGEKKSYRSCVWRYT